MIAYRLSVHLYGCRYASQMNVAIAFGAGTSRSSPCVLPLFRLPVNMAEAAIAARNERAGPHALAFVIGFASCSVSGCEALVGALAGGVVYWLQRAAAPSHRTRMHMVVDTIPSSAPRTCASRATHGSARSFSLASRSAWLHPCFGPFRVISALLVRTSRPERAAPPYASVFGVPFP